MRFYGIHVAQAKQDIESSKVQLKHMRNLIQRIDGVREENPTSIDLTGAIPPSLQKQLINAYATQKKRRGAPAEEIDSIHHALEKEGGFTHEELQRMRKQFLDGEARAAAAIETGKELLDAVIDTHAFTFEGGMVEALLGTSAPHPERLPFWSCYLDVDLDVDDWTICGVTVAECQDPQATAVPGKALLKEASTEPPDDFFILAFLQRREPEPERAYGYVTVAMNYHSGMPSIGLGEVLGKRTLQRVKRTLIDFVASWAACVLDPDILVVETCKAPNARKKLAAAHGNAPKGVRAVRLTGTLRRYIQAQRMHAEANQRSGVRAHWRRGHFRTFRAARYSPEVRGTSCWVPPHIVGTGALVRNTYEMSVEKNARSS